MEENAVKEKNEYEMVEMVAVEHLSEHVQKPDIAWVNLNFRAKDKVILSDCWGKVNAGQVCAVMGPSGSGKSSLLNVLAGRSAPAPGIFIEGRITVGGKLINPVSFRKNIAYVMQDDAMTPTATPREALLFSASMRLPASYSNSKIRTLVEQLLEELGIAGCADVMIGGAMIKGISGGQRKRTSVGVELVTDPSLLFLDEPTSGLDSYSAFQLVSLLKKVARRDCTVLCTIHQPSSEVFFLFDSVIFMKDGKIFYQGPCKAVINHFEQFAYHCPHNYNPSDFIMTLCQTIPDSEAIAKGIYMTAPEELSQLAHARSSRLDSEVIFQTERSLFRQICELTKREAVTTSRDTAALIGRFGVSMFLYFLFGLIFLGVGGKDYADTSALNNHFGGITELLIGSMFGTAQPIMLSFPFERPTFMREYSTGTYGAPAYFISKLIVEAPMALIQQIVGYLFGYYMLDLQGRFIFIVLAGWALGMCSSSAALFIGCSVTDVKQVSELAPLLFVPQMLFVGFFIPTSRIPVFLRWAQYLCSLKYAMNLVLLTEFLPSSGPCNTSQAAHDNCENILSSNDIKEGDYYKYILVLLGLLVGFRLLGAVVLVQRAKRFY